MKIKNNAKHTVELPAMNEGCPGGAIQPGETVDFVGGEAYLTHDVLSLWFKSEQKMLELVVEEKVADEPGKKKKGNKEPEEVI